MCQCRAEGYTVYPQTKDSYKKIIKKNANKDSHDVKLNHLYLFINCYEQNTPHESKGMKKGA